MRVFRPLHIVKDYASDPEGNTLILQPDEDMLGPYMEDVPFQTSEKVRLQITSADGTWWETFGTIIDIDLDDDDKNPLLLVEIEWGTAAPLTDESTP